VRANLRQFAEQIFREEFKAIEDHIINETNNHTFFRELKSKLWQIKNAFLSRVSKPANEALSIFQEQGWDATEISYGKNSGLITFFEMFAQKSLKDWKEPSERIQNYYMQAQKWPSKTTIRAADIIATAEQKLIPIIHELLETYNAYYKEALSADLV